MRPELKVFVRELERGKTVDDAGKIYCLARMVLPVFILPDSGPADGYPAASTVCDRNSFKLAAAAWRRGADECEIERAWIEGNKSDRASGEVWADSKRRPSAKELLDTLGGEELTKLMGLLGTGTVCRMLRP